MERRTGLVVPQLDLFKIRTFLCYCFYSFIHTWHENRSIPFTMSIGVTERALGAQEVDAIMKRADEALYRAKEARRNRVEMEIP